MAGSLLAVLLATVTTLMRTSRMAWEARRDDFKRLDALHSTVRHVVRAARQATNVTDLSDATDASGRLSLRLADGSIATWDHDNVTLQMNYGEPTANALLASQVKSFRVTGYLADGTTPTTNPTLVRALQIEASTDLQGVASPTRVIRSWAWLRAW